MVWEVCERKSWLGLVADQTSAFGLAYTLTLCNLQCFKFNGSFNYDILSNDGIFNAIHDAYKNQT